MSTVAEDPITVCAGCGGKNPAGSTECDWCGRPFLSKGGRLRITVWQLLSSLLLLGLIGAVAALAYLNAGRTLASPRGAAPAPTAVLPTVIPTPVVTPRVTVANAPTPTLAAPIIEPTLPPPTAEVPPTPEPTATPQLQFARVANTGGLGATVRQQPGPQAPRAGALRDGARVILTGNDQTVAARPWREIETEDHSLKGWVQGDLLQPQSTQ